MAHVNWGFEYIRQFCVSEFMKKIKTQKSENEQQRQTEYQGNHVNENNNNNIHTTIIKMSQDIEYIKTALAELLEKVNKL